MNVLGNIGLTELIVIFLLALLVVGPERLPELSRKLGTLVRDLRQMYTNLSRDLGPEFTSLPETVKQVRDSAQALRTLPRDAILAISQAAALDEEAKELSASLRPAPGPSGAVATPQGSAEAVAAVSTDRSAGAAPREAGLGAPGEPGSAGIDPETEPAAPLRAGADAEEQLHD